MSSKDRFERAMKLLVEVRGLPRSEHEAFLAKACAGDEELLKEVDSLLEHDSTGSGVREMLEPGVGGALLANIETQSFDVSPPSDLETLTEVGDYTLIRKIGQGGMGIIFEAEKAYPRRRVALKLIRTGSFSREALQRFQKEAQVLARLHHPGIAQIYDAGFARCAGDELPFIAMEFIDGLPLTQAIQERKLDRNQVIELMARVCDALQHAHEKGIIHRDLKPGNVFVVAPTTGTEPESGGSTPMRSAVDGVGQPKILDFGIAFVTEEAGRINSLQTEQGQLLGTLSYMSPEQVTVGPASIDHRTDLYSLGVLLYEVLTGRHPYELAGLSFPQSIQVIREVDPDLAGSIDPSLRGDLETIAAKAMAKEPARRYVSAVELGGDLRRVLRDEPILARPPSTFYQLRKFARRNKTLVASVCAIILILTAGVTGTSIGFFAKQREAVRASAIKNVLTDMFESIWPRNSKGEDATLLLNLLAETERRIESGEIKDPEIEGELRSMIGATQTRLAEWEKGQHNLTRAVDLLRTHAGPLAPSTLTAIRDLARVLRLQDQSEAAEALYLEALAGQAEMNATPLATADGLQGLAITYKDLGRFEEAEEMLQRVISIRQKEQGDAHADTNGARLDLGHLYEETGREAESTVIFRRIHDHLAGTEDAAHTAHLSAMSELAEDLLALERFDEALDLARECCLLSEKVSGVQHSRTRTARGVYVRILAKLGLFEESIDPLTKYVDWDRKSNRYGAATVEAVVLLSEALGELGRHEENLDLLSEQYDAVERATPGIGAGLHYLDRIAYCYAEMGQGERAQEIYDRIREQQEELHGGLDYQTLASTNNNAMNLLNQGQAAEARDLLTGKLAQFEKFQASGRPDKDQLTWSTVLRHSLGEAYMALEDWDEAAAIFEKALEGYRAGLVEREDLYDLALMELGGVMGRLGRPEEQRRLAKERVQVAKDKLAAGTAKVGLLATVAQFLMESPDPEIRDPENALLFAKRGCELVQPPDPMLLALVARAHAAAGDFAEAIRVQEQAIERLSVRAPKNVLDQMKQDLRDYRDEAADSE